MPEVLLNYQAQLEIDTAPQTQNPVWARIHKGFKNLSQSINEVLNQASYLGDGGWGSTTVTGGQYIVTLTGERIVGDPAQDYIFSPDVMFKWGKARETTLRITLPNGIVLTWAVTLAKITDGGGDSSAASAITVEVHGNGAPVITGGTLEALTVVSLAGATTGKTAIYVNPAKAVGNSYKYKTGSNLSLPALGEELAAGWTAWDGAVEITAITGDQLVLAEVVTATNKVAKAGRATVTSKA